MPAVRLVCRTSPEEEPDDSRPATQERIRGTAAGLTVYGGLLVLLTGCDGASRVGEGALEPAEGMRMDTVSLACRRGLSSQIGRIGQISVDSSGRLVVLDLSWFRAVIMNADSSCVAVGREGGGPGEFRYPTGLAIAADGRIAVRDDARRAVSFFRPDGTLLGDLRLPLREPQSYNSLVLTGDRIVVSGTVSTRREGVDRELKSRQQFQFFSMTGVLDRSIQPTAPVHGECARPSAFGRGFPAPLAARDEWFLLSDGRLIGGCTQSDSIWWVDPSAPERASLLFVLRGARPEVPGSIRNLLRESTLTRFRRELPHLTAADVDVPKRFPAWRQLVQTGPNSYAALTVDSLYLEHNDSAALPTPTVRSRFRLVWRDLASGEESDVLLPRNVLLQPRMAATHDRVYLMIELPTGEEAILRVARPGRER